MSVLNLDQKLTVDNKKIVQIGGEEYELIFNDKFAKLVADMQLKVAEATKDFDDDAKLEQFAKKEYAEQKEQLMAAFDKGKVVVVDALDQLLGEGEGERLYKYYNESTQALTALVALLNNAANDAVRENKAKNRAERRAKYKKNH
ncbi:hypothetical protein FC14_GL000612 [Ligilactobacillus agilis DSM 20509]|uniref:Uncharacterized protein n=1 Tax=Ligilactobacillus agilis DSM 20509 TaxID=1423718 RepID=A0A0R2ACC5_9LACO|nr:hypothetical protein [Ligilactobacillus agilis]KRM63332.1 hypothetical protein FC14_GL000612 [Ligilactobacillus agilis DSM 20509]